MMTHAVPSGDCVGNSETEHHGVQAPSTRQLSQRGLSHVVGPDMTHLVTINRLRRSALNLFDKIEPPHGMQRSYALTHVTATRPQGQCWVPLCVIPQHLCRAPIARLMMWCPREWIKEGQTRMNKTLGARRMQARLGRNMSTQSEASNSTTLTAAKARLNSCKNSVDGGRPSSPACKIAVTCSAQHTCGRYFRT